MSSRIYDRGLVEVALGDGRGLLALTGIGLVVAGAFAFFVSAAGQFLPHDIEYLAMTAAELRALEGGRIVEFMFHDRVAFGGSLVAVGVLYLWLAAFPLRAGEAWAWWTLALSGALGFGSFLGYLGYGYLDSWHGVATLALLPAFALGLARSWKGLSEPRGPRALLRPGAPARAGRLLLMLTAVGMVVAGLTILTIGSFVVFVPQDLEFIGLDRAALDAINPRLVPLIAHDRAGFGGGIATTGAVVLACVWCARPSRSLWEALLIAGVVGFGAAIGIHGLVGYLDLSHVGPAVLGAVVYAAGMLLSRPTPPALPDG